MWQERGLYLSRITPAAVGHQGRSQSLLLWGKKERGVTPRTGQETKKQPLYLVTALVQIVTRKQPATIIHPQPPSGGPACRARRGEAMAIPPSFPPQWRGPTPAGTPSTGRGCPAHGLLDIWRERERERKTGRKGMRVHGTHCNPHGQARTYRAGIIHFRVIHPAITSSHFIPFYPHMYTYMKVTYFAGANRCSSFAISGLPPLPSLDCIFNRSLRSKQLFFPVHNSAQFFCLREYNFHLCMKREYSLQNQSRSDDEMTSSSSQPKP